MWSIRSRVTTLAIVATVTAAALVYLSYRKNDGSSKKANYKKSDQTKDINLGEPSSSSSEAAPSKVQKGRRSQHAEEQENDDKKEGETSVGEKQVSAEKTPPLRLCDATSPKSVTIWHASWSNGSNEGSSRSWPLQFGQCLSQQLSSADKTLIVEKKSLEIESPEIIFTKYGGADRLNLLILPSNSEGETAIACRRLQNWLRSYIARRADDGSNAEEVVDEEQHMSQFYYQVLGVDVDASQDGALVYCSVAIEMDRLLAVAGCKRFASMYTLTSQMSSRRGYVLSLLDTLGVSQSQVVDPSNKLPAPPSPPSPSASVAKNNSVTRHPVGLFYASWSCVSKTFAYELREILRNFLRPPLDAFDVRCMGTLTIDDLVNNYDTAVFLVSSYTYGDPPPAVMNFWKELCDDRQAGRERLSSFSFGILGLGDTTYFANCFCKAAYDLETLLMACGACRILPLATCDQMLGQQPLQFRLWANTILGPSLKRHISEPSKLNASHSISTTPLQDQLTHLPGRASGTDDVLLSSTDTDTNSPAARRRTLLILYGTQSGASERYARELEKRTSASIDATILCHDIEDFDPTHLSKNHPQPSLVVFVVSTYGDGDPPESCQTFYKSLKEEDEKLVAFFTNVSFCIVALGNSGYPSYCGFGTKLSRALRAIPGTSRKLPMLKLDENGQDPEKDFESWWKTKFQKLVVDIYGAKQLQTSDRHLPPAEAGGGDNESRHLFADDVHFKLVPCQRKHETTPAQHKCHQSLQQTVPSSALSKDIYKSSIQFEIVDCRVFGADVVTPSSRYTYEVTVQSTKALDEVSFYPGSTFGFFPQQSPADSQWLLEEVFEWKGRPASEVDKEVVVFEGKEPIKTPLPQGVSLREIVESLTDFGATPSFSWLHQELRSSLPVTHPYRASEAYSAHLDELVKSVPLTLVETLKVLHSKSSFRLPLEFLLSMKRQVPRQYTVASSIDRDRGLFRLIVSETSLERTIPEELTSIIKPQLQGLVSQMLRKIYNAGSTQIIRGLPKMALFTQHAWQLGGVWIAVGSGIAPFIGFLEERRLSGIQSFGKTILFFGCRSSSESDLIGKSTILEAVRDGFLEAAFFAFSRDPHFSRGVVKPGSLDIELIPNTTVMANEKSDQSSNEAEMLKESKRVYIQDRLNEEMDLVKTLLESNAEEVSVRQESETALSGDAESSSTPLRVVTHKIMICGSNDMGKAVVDTLNSALGEEKLKGSILMEVW